MNQYFFDCLFGFRAHRSMYEAIGVINHSLVFERINYVIDFNIEGYFDNID